MNINNLKVVAKSVLVKGFSRDGFGGVEVSLNDVAIEPDTLIDLFDDIKSQYTLKQLEVLHKAILKQIQEVA